MTIYADLLEQPDATPIPVASRSRIRAGERQADAVYEPDGDALWVRADDPIAEELDVGSTVIDAEGRPRQVVSVGDPDAGVRRVLLFRRGR